MITKYNQFLCFFLLSFALPISAEEVHYIGRANFPIEGIKYASKNDCTWNISGTVNLILSFSRSTSLAALRVRQKGVPQVVSAECSNFNQTTFYKIPLVVDPSDKSFSAIDQSKQRFISGTTVNKQVNGVYEYKIFVNKDGQQFRNSWQGSFNASLVKIPGEMIDVKNVEGSVITAITLGASTVKDSIVDASTVITETDSFATLVEKFGTEVKLNPRTILTRLPIKNIDNKDIRTFSLMRGKIDSVVKIKDRNFKVLTPAGSIEVLPVKSNTTLIKQIIPNNVGELSIRSQFAREEDGATVFATEYEQAGDNGSVTVSVTSGSVIVTSIDGNKTLVSAGEEQTLSQIVSRTTWVQPADGGILYSNAENILAWTAYPDAVSYLIEYNLPSPIFAEDNTSKIEYELQTLKISADMVTEHDGLIIYLLDLPEMPELPIEARVFALDSAGNIIGDSVSSDRATLSVK